MEQASTKITRFLILFIIVVVVIKNASMLGFFEPKDHKGRGYYVKVPSGWKMVKKQKGVVYPDGVEVVMFVPKEADLDQQESDVYISLFVKKLTTPVWIEDEMPDILRSIVQGGNKIMDKGEIKIDGTVSQWVVYHDLKTPELVIEFYMVTDTSVFFKIQYAAPPDKFNKLRGSLEEFKKSFKFRFSLY